MEEMTTASPTWAELREYMLNTSKIVRETSEQLKETGRRMDELNERAEKDRIKSEKHFKQLENLYTTQWGKLVEAMTQPAALKLFKDEGIAVNHIYWEGKSEKDGHAMEVDIILCNGTEVVAVEVKTICRVCDVDNFISQMQYFKMLFSEFSDRKVYVAIAALKFNEFSDDYALKKGMYVLHAQGDGLFSMKKPDGTRLEY